MTPQELANPAHLRRARDLIDRDYARPIERAMALLRALRMPVREHDPHQPGLSPVPTGLDRLDHRARVSGLFKFEYLLLVSRPSSVP